MGSIGEPHSFIAPKQNTSSVAALVWIQGADTPAHVYKPLLEAVQAAAPELALWIGQPSFTGNTPEPALLGHNIDATLKLMYDAGMPKDAKLYFGGHSLGTVFLQMWCVGDARCRGQILTGGFIARKNYYPGFNFTVPTLTMGGSLDGLARVTRTVAESFYQQITLAGKGDTFPVAVIEGMNHYQWGSEEPPTLEKKRDIQAELTLEEAHTQAAAIAGDWLQQLYGVSGAGAKVKSAVAATEEFVAPIIAAYQYEGSRSFNAPAQIGGPGAKKCVKGGCPDQSRWAVVAQGVIAGDLPDGWKLTASNNFVDCSSTPITGQVFHLPNITNDTTSKTVHTTTYSQCNWALGDKEDTGFVYTSASEIGTKLSSRQCLYIKGVGLTDTPFSVDDPDFCKMSNQKAYDWALAQAGARTLARYKKDGQPYTFGPDIPKSGGPLFLDAGITYKDNGDAGVEISSPMQKTSIDYWKKHFPFPRPSAVPDPGCFHYCKLLSPARAMEWIYVDGLRRHRPLKVQ